MSTLHTKLEPVVEGTSGAEEHSEIKGTSAEAEHTEIKATSAEAEHTDIEGISAASAENREIEEHMGSFLLEMKRLIKETQAESKKSKKTTRWPTNSIFRVPPHIRSNRESNFEPKLVSIGPYYHGLDKLKCMEDLKIRCIKEVVKMMGIAANRAKSKIPLSDYRQLYETSSREPSTKVDIHDVFLRQFMVSEKKARAYYKEEFYHSPEDFVKMLFLDSCFIIRTIFALSQHVQESMSFLDVHIKEVRSDLLLLDNQIPLFFVKEIYEWFVTVLDDQNLPMFDTVLEQFICLDMPWRMNHGAMSSKDAAHLLDLYWRCSLSPEMFQVLTSLESSHPESARSLSMQRVYSYNSSKIDLSNNALMVVANATELQQMAGIEFKKFKDKCHLDVIFSKGIMRMPRLKIDSRQITLLRNLIAFENCIIPFMRNISCYMKLMDALIDSENDVKLLQKYGVIYNTLTSHEMAATFFNDIGDFCFTDDNANRFSDLYKGVQKYYNSSCNRRLASLRQNYFSSPWAAISLFAAVILLILSVVQTFFSVYGYYKPNN